MPSPLKITISRDARNCLQRLFREQHPGKPPASPRRSSQHAGANPHFDPSNSHFDPSKSQFDPSKCDFDGSNSCTRQEEAGRDSRKTHLEPYEKRTVACRKGKRTVRNENHNALLNQFKTKP